MHATGTASKDENHIKKDYGFSRKRLCSWEKQVRAPWDEGGAKFGQPVPRHVDVTTALARAEDLYNDGKLTQALHWIEQAHEILAIEIELAEDPVGEQLSNARQLLKHLNFYGDFAFGFDQELD